MERNPYLKESDLKEKEHFPVYVFFNMISENSFLDVYESFSKGIGRGIEFAVCLFPDDIDIPSEKFDGVEFSLHSGEEVVIDYSTFYFYLNKACERYLELHNGDKEILKTLIEKIKQKFTC